MKLIHIVLFSLISASGIPAMADVQPIKPGDKEEKVAAIAGLILSVTKLNLGEVFYKTVTMDSELNGDLTETTLLFVSYGATSVGNSYEASFLLTPVGDAGSLKSARIENGEIALTFNNRNARGTIKKFVHYDATSGTLRERLGK